MPNCFDDSATTFRIISGRFVSRYIIRYKIHLLIDRMKIYGKIYSDEAATTAEEWFAGTDAEPILVSLKVSNNIVFDKLILL